VVNKGSTKGVTVVVSPLLSLINDQVSNVIKKGINATYLASDLEADSWRMIFHGNYEGQVHKNCSLILIELSSDMPTIKLVYITPEMMSRSQQFNSCLKGLYKRGVLARYKCNSSCASFRLNYVKVRCR
jgi:superfamily II DNA helicase RecQ